MSKVGVVRTLKDVGKLEELQHEMKRYDWNILVSHDCSRLERKARRKVTDYSGVSKTTYMSKVLGSLSTRTPVNCVIDCCPISNRLITIRLRAKPLNITIIQAYAPTSAYSNEDVEVFYEELQKILNKTPKKDILVVQGDWNANIGEDAYENWKGTYGRHCNIKLNERGFRLLRFASYNDLMVANTFGSHKNPEKSLGTVQMGKPTIRLITSW